MLGGDELVRSSAALGGLDGLGEGLGRDEGADGGGRGRRLGGLAELCAQGPGGRLVGALSGMLNVEGPQGRGGAAEWLEAAGDEGAAIVEAYREDQ